MAAESQHDGPAPEGIRIEAASPEQMEAIGAALAAALEPGDIVALDGDLGAGKTVLARGMAAGLGIDPALVSSPTFVLMQRYGGGRMDLVHADAYRVRSLAEFEAIGWSEQVERAGAVAVVEWASRIDAMLPPNALRILITHEGEQQRALVVRSDDALLQARAGEAMRSAIQLPPCPICGRPISAGSPEAPFCSPRCRKVDLGRWLGERYRVSRPLSQNDLEPE